MLNLGIIYNKSREIINHRSLLKIFINPLFRMFGFVIATKSEEGELEGLTIIRCEKVSFIKSLKMINYHLENGDFVVKKRMFF